MCDLRYYIEIVDTWTGDYIMQSKWFDDKEKALEFADSFDFLFDNLKICLMCGIFKEDCDCLSDIYFVKEIY